MPTETILMRIMKKRIFKKLYIKTNRFFWPKQKFITPGELVLGLCTFNVGVVTEFLSFAKNARAEEIDRAKSLDTKAASLFSFIGVLGSITLFALSVKADQPFFSIIKNTNWGISLMILVLLCLLISLVLLFFATKVVATKSGISEQALIGGILLYDIEDKGCKEDGHKYRRYLAEHVWKAYRASYMRNEKKADLLAYAQSFLFGALVAVVAFLMAAMVHIKNMPEDTKPQVVQTETTTVSPAPARPEPLMVSPEPGRITNSERPVPLRPSPEGHTEQRGLRPSPLRPSPLRPSPTATAISESKDKK